MIRFAWAAVFVVMLATVSTRGEEPTFKDRPLSAWVADLKAKDAGTRRDAAKALAELGSEAASAANALGELLRDEELEVRREAAQALPRLGRRAVPVLAAALKDRGRTTRKLAAEALAVMGANAQK